MAQQPEGRTFVERRKKRDWVSRAVPIISGVGWAAAFFTLMFLEKATPQQADLFTRLFNIPLQSAWNTQMLAISLATLILVFLVCAAGFVFNILRHRRKEDKYNKSIIILGCISLVSIVVFLITFADIL